MDRLTATGMKDTRYRRALNDRLVATLKPFAPPAAISFHGGRETLRVSR